MVVVAKFLRPSNDRASEDVVPTMPVTPLGGELMSGDPSLVLNAAS